MNAKPKILIVDDRKENLVALKRVLQDLNIDLIEATSGNEALKKTLHNDFALALLDIQMPEMDGYELASILREEEKTMHLPFIFISAVYTDNLNVFKGYEKGAFSFITKPFQPEILINKVKFFIDKHQQEIALYNLNNDLKSMNTELEAFSYSVSHDLRAPLRAVNGYAQMLNEDYSEKLDQEGKRIIEAIKYNSIKMGTLIDDLLSFSRLGRKEIVKTNIDMNQLINAVIFDINKTIAHEAEIKINILHDLEGDYNLMHHVMFNLISNAIKYSSKNKRSIVEINSEEINNQIIFKIKDNGVGFDMKFADKLFGVFQRLHKSSDFEGTGVGLAIVQRIITKHGGKIWFDSELGKGATFYFSLF